MKERLWKKGLVIGIILLFVGAGVIPSTGIMEKSTKSIIGRSILYVGGSGPGNYTSIQDAIDNASDGDTVFVYNDSSPYYENIGIDKSINLVGEDKNTTVIDGDGVGDGLLVSANSVNISGFTIQNSNEKCIFLEASNNSTISDNILIDSDWGIQLVNSNNNKIIDCHVSNNMWGINIGSNISSSGNNNTISNCHISTNFALGVHLFGSSNTNIHGNTFIADAIGIAGSSLEHFTHNIDTTNTVNGKPLYYFVNEKEVIIDNWEIGQLILVNCTGFSISNVEISGTEIGLEAAFCSNNSITDCIFRNNWYGIYFMNSSYNVIENCSLNNNSGPMDRDGPWWANGISIIGSHNIIKNNNASNNEVGIIILTFSALPSFVSVGNVIEGNDIYSNSYCGIYLFDSSDNFVYHNNFINNAKNAYDNGTNTWDNGYPSGGNYWDDYDGVDEYPKDGIGDTPYNIPGGSNQDRYPWMYPDGDNKVELHSAFLIGLVSNVYKEEDFSWFAAKLLLYFRVIPFDLKLYRSSEQIIISNEYLGYVGLRFIIGCFNASVVSEE